MAYEQPKNFNESQPVAQSGTQASIEMAEEVRRRWVGIASYYVAQRKRFLQTTMPAGWLDVERDIGVSC